jgi:hypothetical protein
MSGSGISGVSRRMGVWSEPFMVVMTYLRSLSEARRGA